MARRWPDLSRFGARLTFDGAAGSLTVEVRTNNFDIGLAAAGFVPAGPHKWQREGPNIRQAELASIFPGFDKDADTRFMGDGAVMWSDTGFCAKANAGGALIESEFEIECEVFPAIERALRALPVDGIVSRLCSFCWPPRQDVTEADAEDVRAMALAGRVNWNTYGIFTTAVIDALQSPDEEVEQDDFRSIVEVIEEAELTHVVHIHGLGKVGAVACGRAVPPDVVGAEFVRSEQERIGKDLCVPSPLVAALDEIDGGLLQWVEESPGGGAAPAREREAWVDTEQSVIVGVDRSTGAFLILKEASALSRLALTGLRMAPPVRAAVKAKAHLDACYEDVQRQVRASSRHVVSSILLNRIEGMINQAGGMLGYASAVNHERTGVPRIVHSLASEPLCMLFSDLWTRALRMGAAGSGMDADEEMVEAGEDDAG